MVADKFKLALLNGIRRCWGGRVSRTTFLIGLALYVFMPVALFYASELVISVAPFLMIEGYIVVLFVISLASFVGITRLYTQRLHDMGFSGLWTIPALFVAPILLTYLGSEYSDWRFTVNNEFPTGQFSVALLWLLAAGIVGFALSKASVDDDRFGEKPEVIASPRSNAQLRWMFIGLAVFGMPYFAYLGYFNSRIWVGRSDREVMPTKSNEHTGRKIMSCWGFKGISAILHTEGNNKYEEELSMLSFRERDGFLKYNAGDNVYNFVIKIDGSIDIITAGDKANSFLNDRYEIKIKTSSRINFDLLKWYKSDSLDILKITAEKKGPHPDDRQEYIFDIIRKSKKDPRFDYSYKVILTNIYISSVDSHPIVESRAMIGECFAF